MEENSNLDPWYVTGFTDGEGCFSLFINTERRSRRGYVSVYSYWRVHFSITLRKDDIEILKRIGKFFDCGTLNINTAPSQIKKGHRGIAIFTVAKREDLVKKIIPHFDKYNLMAKKRSGYELWKKATMILYDAQGRGEKTNVATATEQILTEKEEQELIRIKTLLAYEQTAGSRKRALGSARTRGQKRQLEVGKLEGSGKVVSSFKHINPNKLTSIKQ